MSDTVKNIFNRFIPEFFYGWIVVGACFICCASYGTFYTFGVFFRPLQDQFGWSFTLTSSVQSVHIFFYVISSLLFGWATDRFGPRLPLIIGSLCVGFGYLLCSRIESISDLYIYYSIASIGAGVVWSLPLSTVQRWFIVRRGLALGLALSGIGIGTLIWAPTVNYFIHEYGWRTAYAAMGAIVCSALGLASLLIATPEDKGVRPLGSDEHFSNKHEQCLPPLSKREDMKLSDALRTSQLWLICLIQFLFNIGIFFIFVHLVPFAIQRGINGQSAAKAVGLIGGLSVLGRIIMPMIVEKKMASRWERGLFICSIGATLMLLWLSRVHNFWMLYLFALIYGFFYGGWIPLVVALTGNYFGLKSLGALLGIIQIGLIGGIVGPLIGGFTYDKMGNYSVAFSTCSTAFFLAGIITFIIKNPRAPS
ncbi:MAG: MFS transporter [Deltaproteobacteria bacterium]|nr:MFS transporter [Deltaproteobacteria bacterium]